MLGAMVIRKKEKDMTDLQRRLSVFLKEQSARLDRELEEAREEKDWDRVTSILTSMAEITSIERQVGITKKAKYEEWIQEVVRNAQACAESQKEEDGKEEGSAEEKKKKTI